MITVNNISIDEALENSIKEELKKEYWQEVINYKGFSQNCDLEILGYQFDVSRLLFHFRIRYKNTELIISLKSNEVGIKDFSNNEFNVVLLRTKIAAELIKQKMKQNIKSEKCENIESKKPPLGITPHFIWIEQRIDEIINAIDRYRDAKQEIPKEWYFELAGLETEKK